MIGCGEGRGTLSPDLAPAAPLELRSDWTNASRAQARCSCQTKAASRPCSTGCGRASSPAPCRPAPACRRPARWPRNWAWPARRWCWPTSGSPPRAMSAPAPAAAPTSPPTCRTPPRRRPCRRRPPPVRCPARGQRLAAVPASAASRDAGLGTLLAGGIPAPDLFPKEAWARCAARVLKSLSSDITGYPPPQGLPELRGQIAAHLAATRGLLADPANIVVTAGTQQALRIAAELLLDPGDAAWVEDPGYIAGRGALLAAGAAPVPVLSDAEGLDVAAGIQRAPDARLALVAPSHATPLGGALPIGRRLALLDWAGRANAWILEDDCDSEFRWSGHPLPPLATLDRAGRVIYCGTFSKTLAPALRLGFAVVPAPLVPAFVRARHADGSRHRHAQPGDPGGVHAPGTAVAACPPHAHRICPPPRRAAGGDRAPCAVDRADPGARRAAHGRAAAGRHRTKPPRCRPAAAAASRCRRWVRTTPGRRAWRGWSWGSPARRRRWPPILRGGWRVRCARFQRGMAYSRQAS